MNIHPARLMMTGALIASATAWIFSRDSAARAVEKNSAPPSAVSRIGAASDPKLAASVGAIDRAVPAMATHRHAPAAITPAFDHLFARLIPSLLTADPAAAVDSVERWTPGIGRTDALARFARLWAATDPDTALRWAAGLPGDERRIAGEALVTHFAAIDPGSALVAAQFFEVHQGDGRAERIMQSWTEQEPAAAIAWISARKPTPAVDRLAARIAWTLAQRDPAAAAEVAIELVSAGPAREEAILSVVRHWAVRDPRAAMAWVESFPAGARRERSLALLRSVRATTMRSGS